MFAYVPEKGNGSKLYEISGNESAGSPFGERPESGFETNETTPDTRKPVPNM